MFAFWIALFAFGQVATQLGPAEWYARGMAHAQRQEYQEARRCLRKAVELDPDSSSLRINLGTVSAKLGLNLEARKHYRLVLSRDPGHAVAMFNLGSLYLEAGDARRALPLLRQASLLAPHDEEILRKKLIAEVRAGTPQEIRESLQPIAPERCSVASGLGRELLARRSNLSLELALEQFRREQQCGPGDLEPVLGEAGALLAMGQAEEAIRALTSRHANVTGNKHAQWILGSACERLGKYPEAFQHFAAAVDLDPGDRRGYMALGLLGLKGGTPQLSQKVFEDGARRFPNAAEFQMGQALVAQSSGDARKAAELSWLLIAAQPQYAPARLFLAALHLDARQYDAALQVLDGVLRATPASLLAIHLRAAVRFAQAGEKPGPPVQAAMLALEGALRSEPKFPDGHILLARYFRTRDDSASAEKHLKLALEARPEAWQARFLLAQLRRKQGEGDLASDELKTSEDFRKQESHSRTLMWRLLYGDEDTR